MKDVIRTKVPREKCLLGSVYFINIIKLFSKFFRILFNNQKLTIKWVLGGRTILKFLTLRKIYLIQWTFWYLVYRQKLQQQLQRVRQQQKFQQLQKYRLILKKIKMNLHTAHQKLGFHLIFH